MNRPDCAGCSRRDLLIAAALALLAALPFLIAGPSSSFIAFDDPEYVYENVVVRQGLSLAGIRWAFTTFHGANWHPLTWISHLADVSLFGLDARGHHLTSIALHAGNAALLYLALVRLTGALRPSLLVAALFGVHPLRVESVAWVAERKDVLAALFFLLALLAWERYLRRGGAGRYAAAAAFLALGLLAKPMLVTVPALLLLLDVWPLGRLLPFGGGTPASRSRALFEKLPLVALAAASAAVTFVAQRSGGAVMGFQTFPADVRVANALVSPAAYLGKIFWPAHLSIFYPFPHGGVPAWQTAAAVLFLLGASAACARLIRSRPALAVGWFWYLGMLLPVVGLVQVGGQALADRYTYLPSIGVLLALAWGLPEWARLRRVPAAFPVAAAVLVVAALAAASARQATHWRSAPAIALHGLSVAPESSVLKQLLVKSYFRDGETARGYGAQGDLQLEMGFFAQAIDAYQKMLAAPGTASSESYRKLGTAYRGAGRRFEAQAAFARAVELEPGNAQAQLDLGLILLEAGRPAEARPVLERHLALRPASAEGHNALGLTMLIAKDPREAAPHFARAVELKGDFAEARFNLGQASLLLGDRQGALREQRALQSIDPALAENLGRRLR